MDERAWQVKFVTFRASVFRNSDYKKKVSNWDVVLQCDRLE
jgi:hypothetical protein